MEGLGSFLLFAALFYFMMRFGCGSHMTHGHGGHDHSSSNTSDSGYDDGTGKYVDPVCDMEVETEQGYGKMYQGTLYRFCSRNCLDKFDNEPERYINKQQAFMMEEKNNDH